MQINKKNKARNIDLILIFLKLIHSNPRIAVNDKLYNAIRKKVRMLIEEMEEDNVDRSFLQL